LVGRRDELTARIDRLEVRISEIDELFCDPDYYEGTSQEEITELDRERGRLQEELDGRLEEWEELEREIETPP
jgi:hypothetical protein